ncbi:hypothetical protein SAMN05216338_104767 [Bradyrhizobium sp. Rc2d]|uniref:DUF6314 family protein n=1 Tax=Bradyrhizobium sp. Rc2d TaxID=1855321 RepID=UPI000885D750|nr:DUF6314 family protein [Bradyrhizobium sp. Rc2d]SDJ37455.1 hypothetical protein SAMN05216338_104767 [Bradyrhizobium sp. Rc2d]
MSNRSTQPKPFQPPGGEFLLLSPTVLVNRQQSQKLACCAEALETADAQVSFGPWGKPEDVFMRLEGSWQLHRCCADQMVMAGTAVFSAGLDGSLTYLERGRLRLDDRREYDAERKYVYTARPRGFAVFFAETRQGLFHEVELKASNAGLSGRAVHLCAADFYESTYEFLTDGRMIVRHNVLGPKKNYCLTTFFVKDAMANEQASLLEPTHEGTRTRRDDGARNDYRKGRDGKHER